jgi:hypothetical protein
MLLPYLICLLKELISLNAALQLPHTVLMQCLL